MDFPNNFPTVEDVASQKERIKRIHASEDKSQYVCEARRFFFTAPSSRAVRLGIEEKCSPWQPSAAKHCKVCKASMESIRSALRSTSQQPSTTMGSIPMAPSVRKHIASPGQGAVFRLVAGFAGKYPLVNKHSD